MFSSVLMVCVGNICRSPMAEAVMANAVSSLGRNITVHSAGVAALVGSGADPIAITLMQERGLSLDAHRAQQVSVELVQQHELILVMEDWQRRKLETDLPVARGRIMRLGHWRNEDIADPYRRPREAFERALEQIDACTNDWLERL